MWGPVFHQWSDWAQLIKSPLVKWLWMLPRSAHSHGLPSLWDLAAGTALDFVEPDPKSYQLTLQCGSLNVCTLRPQEYVDAGGLYAPALQQALQSQCLKGGYHVMGVQETRLPRASHNATSDFLLFNSAATEGQAGAAFGLLRAFRARKAALLLGNAKFWSLNRDFSPSWSELQLSPGCSSLHMPLTPSVLRTSAHTGGTAPPGSLRDSARSLSVPILLPGWGNTRRRA